MTRHFLKLNDLSSEEILGLIDRAIDLKRLWQEKKQSPLIMKNRTLALVFEKASTRTRVSFEVAANHFGGSAIFISAIDSQLNRGESLADTAKVLSSMVDVIVTRTSAHSATEAYAENSIVPVINGLSDDCHPCQMLADLMTMKEFKGDVSSSLVTWIGDGNNMCVTWAAAACMLGFRLRISTPRAYAPSACLMEEYDSSCIEYIDDPYEAAVDADVIVTDTWSSMGQEAEKEQRKVAFASYRVTSELMKVAKLDAIFMHCLPAYRNMEVESAVIDGNQSVVFEEAENRLHAQKALVELLLNRD